MDATWARVGCCQSYELRTVGLARTSDRKAMKNTPSALKWLAEKRARTAHDLEQTVHIAAEVERRLAGLTLDLAALDLTVRIYDQRINPGQIETVNGWR